MFNINISVNSKEVYYNLIKIFVIQRNIKSLEILLNSVKYSIKECSESVVRYSTNNNYSDIVKILLEKSDIDFMCCWIEKNHDINTCTDSFCVFMKRNNIEIVKLLINKYKCIPTNTNFIDILIEKNCLEIVKLIANMKSYKITENILFKSLDYKNLEIIEYLCKFYGKDKVYEIIKEEIVYILSRTNMKIAKFIIEFVGSNITHENINSLFLESVKYGNIELAEYLRIYKNVDPILLSTILDYIIMNGTLKSLKYLLKFNKNKNVNIEHKHIDMAFNTLNVEVLKYVIFRLNDINTYEMSNTYHKKYIIYEKVRQIDEFLSIINVGRIKIIKNLGISKHKSDVMIITEK